MTKSSGVLDALSRSRITGVVAGQGNVVAIVMDFDSALLPHASSVKMLDAVPPGIAATKAHRPFAWMD